MPAYEIIDDESLCDICDPDDDFTSGKIDRFECDDLWDALSYLRAASTMPPRAQNLIAEASDSIRIFIGVCSRRLRAVPEARTGVYAEKLQAIETTVRCQVRSDLEKISMSMPLNSETERRLRYLLLAYEMRCRCVELADYIKSQYESMISCAEDMLSSLDRMAVCAAGKDIAGYDKSFDAASRLLCECERRWEFCERRYSEFSTASMREEEIMRQIR